jgi:hypothetical protein
MVVADDLIDGNDGGATGGVADDTRLAASVIRLGGGGSCETKNSGGSDEGDDGFHMSVWKLYPHSLTRSAAGYSATLKIFFTHC